MMRPVLRGLVAIEERFDQWKLQASRTLVPRPLTIVPYMGWGGGGALHVHGRVLVDAGVPPATADDSVWTNLANTVRRFETDEVPFAQVRAAAADATADLTCDEEGYFSAVLHPRSALPRQGWHQVALELRDAPSVFGAQGPVRAQAPVLLVPPDAQFGVISDLDDTVMRTDVLNVLRMLRNTFLRNAQTRLPFEGVAAFYRALVQGTDGGATLNPIFYVSSSPWNLYDVIVDFFRVRGIPLGPLLLKNYGISRRKLLGGSHLDYKLGVIRRLLAAHPHLRFVLIGDSGQKDAEAYHRVVIEHPGRVAAVYIRDVTHKARRDAHVTALARQTRAQGVELLLVKDTLAAAEHAAARGLILPSTLPAIQDARNADENATTLLEQILE